MLSLRAFADELEREKARQRVTDAMVRKAKAGHVPGGRVFGYDNVEVLGTDGKRSHVERRINPSEAAIVRRIFEMYVAGTGYTRIAKTLNADGVTAPRPHGHRARGDMESRYLLCGFARCAICGGGIGAMTRSHGKRRAAFYGCVALPEARSNRLP